MTKQELRNLADDPEMMKVACQAVQEYLIVLRDARISESFRGNGMVVREANGKQSDIIRMGPEGVMKVGLRAIAEKLSE